MRLASATASASSAQPLSAAAVESLARSALACKTLGTTFDATCPAMKAWTDAREGFEGGKADAALVALLADGDEKVRYLAAFKLNQHGAAYRTDRALAQATIRAVAHEKSSFAGFEVGSALGRIRVSETGTLPALASIVKDKDCPTLRLGVLGNLLNANPDVAAVFDLVKSTVKDPDRTVGLGALRAFWTGGAKNPAATCDVYAENVDNADGAIAAEASNALSWYGKCQAQYDALLDSLDRRVTTGASALGAAQYMTAARHVCADGAASAKQKQRAAQIGRAVASKTEVKTWVRGSALDTVWACEPNASARSFVSGFKADPEKPLADKARDLLAKK